MLNNEQNIADILQWIRTVDKSTLPYDIVGVGWGPKIKNNIETDEYGIIFTVDKKKLTSALDEDKIIPTTFSVCNIEAVTDVQEKKIHTHQMITCHTLDDTVVPVSQHRTRRRPLQGGIEAETHWGSYVATLGLLVRDKSDGQVVALSNCHVLGSSQVIAAYGVKNSSNLKNVYNLQGYQPTGYYKTTQLNDLIGDCKRPVVIGNKDFRKTNDIINDTTCDAAILRLTDYSLIDSTSVNVVNFNQLGPFQFATDEEIDSLVNPASVNYGAPVYRSGRTSGPVGYPGYVAPCTLSVYQLNTAAVGGYGIPSQVSYFSNCFYVRGRVSPGASGDSGSAFFAQFKSVPSNATTWKCIGLLFAGPGNDNYYSVGCRITSITSSLDIVPWNGTIPTLTSTQTIALSNTSTQAVITLSGRKFYQLGRV